MEGVLTLPDSEELLVNVPAANLVAVNLKDDVSVEKKDLDAADSFFTLHDIDASKLDEAQKVELHGRLLRVPIGVGVENSLS